jgi:hypothetical protein
MKICSNCKKRKINTEFYTTYTTCKPCTSRHRILNPTPTKTRGTLQYFKAQTWSNLNCRTINGSSPQWGHPNIKRFLEKGVRLEINKEDFYEWCSKHEKLILSLYTENSSPSIDRIDSNLHYSLDNIRVIPWRENQLLGIKAHVLKHSKPIIGTNIRTNEVVTFPSRCAANREGFLSSSILKCIKGECSQHKGYTWSEL